MRKRKGLQQQEAAQRLSIAQNTLSQYEGEIRRVPAALLPKLAKLYGCTIEDLYGEEEVQ